MYLSSRQQWDVELLLQEKEERCEACGSTDLRAGEDARSYFGGGAAVAVWCPNIEDKAHAGGVGLKWYYSLTAEEARRIGLA